MLNKNKDKVLFSDQDVKNVLHKKISGKKDTQTTLLGHITLKSSDISNFIYIKAEGIDLKDKRMFIVCYLN